MRKEIIGRPPHSALPSICFRVSLKAVLVLLADRKKDRKSETRQKKLILKTPIRCWDSQQLLQRPLLEGLVGAVDDVGLKVVRGVVLDDIADVPDHWIVIVTPLEVLKKPENAEIERGGGEAGEEVTLRVFPPTG